MCPIVLFLYHCNGCFLLWQLLFYCDGVVAIIAVAVVVVVSGVDDDDDSSGGGGSDGGGCTSIVGNVSRTVMQIEVHVCL